MFRTLKPGEPLLFKLHYPDNAIVGGGFFAHASLIEAGVAWEAFGEKNGAPSYLEMRRRAISTGSGRPACGLPDRLHHPGRAILLAADRLDPRSRGLQPEYRPGQGLRSGLAWRDPAVGTGHEATAVGSWTKGGRG